MRRPASVILVASAAILLLASCGGGSQSSVAGGGGQAGASAGGAVTIRNFAYSPVSLTVRRGTTVRFTNRDSTEHTATATGGGFDSGPIAKGETRSVSLDAAGTFSYVCSFHPFMHGTITVK